MLAACAGRRPAARRIAANNAPPSGHRHFIQHKNVVSLKNTDKSEKGNIPL
jgi:hypothetical protein